MAVKYEVGDGKIKTVDAKGNVRVLTGKPVKL